MCVMCVCVCVCIVQVLMGLPLVADLDMGYHSVVVVATDSQGLGASNPINLYVNSSAFVHFTHRY